MSLRTKLIILFVAFALLPLIAFGAIVFSRAVDSLKSLRIAQLNNIADLKKDKIETYFREREGDVKSAQNITVLRRSLPLLIRHMNDRNNPEYKNAWKSIDDQIKIFQQAYGAYTAVMLTDQRGRIVYVSDVRHGAPSFGNTNEDRHALQEGRKGIYFTDIYLDKARGNIFEIRAMAPLNDLHGAFIGEIVIDIDMAPIYQSLQDSTGLGKTGESLIARKEGDEILFLSPLRHVPDAALKMKVPFTVQTGYAAQKAALGENGSGIAYDYANKEVLAAWRYLSSLRWGLVTKIETSETFAPVRQLRTIVIAVGILTVLFGVFWALSLAKTVTDPVRTLQQGAEAIASGDLTHRVGTDAQDEIGRLSRSFDMMTEALVRDIERRNKAEEEIRSLNQDLQRHVQLLEESNRELEAFSYSVSHDLRSPLRSVVGFSQALAEDYADKLDSGGRDFIGRIVAATKRMSQLIDDLLKLSRISRTEMNRKKVNLSEMAARISEKFREAQPERQVNFIIARGLFAPVDEHLMYLALENLFGNAWKFTGKQAGAVIEFGTTTFDGSEAFFIRDNGSGFDMTYAGKLFTPFQRLHTTAEFPGTGIGLATVKRIIERHGGRIRIEGEPGKGTTVYFTV